MSGGGSSGYIPPSSDKLREKIDKAREAEQQRLESEVNQYLQNVLSRYNDRDIDLTRERLEQLKLILGDKVELDNLLFGGSVAKHTFVDGLSDVDALAIIDHDTSQGISPTKVLNDFYKELNQNLPRKDVASIEKGQLAVTIRYKDGSEIQVLPSIRDGKSIKIPDTSGTGWNKTNPASFQKQLTKQNENLNGALVPSIKLIKSLIYDLPKKQQLTGYHIEALAVEAAKDYKGSMTPKTLLSHIFEHAAKRSLQPLRDISGQSRNVDEYLGKKNSTQRKLVSQAIAGIGRRLNAATSLAQWKAMFGGFDK